MKSESLAQLCIRAALEKKAEDVVALDLRGISDFTDFFVICSGTSDPHLKAIAGEIQNALKSDHRVSPDAVDGYPASQWIILDYSSVIIHVFQTQKREFYGLEALWSDAPQLEIPSA